MDQPVGMEFVVAAWGLFAIYLYWDLMRLRVAARRDLDRLLKKLADAPDEERKRAIREHLSANADAYRAYRARPLWSRWIESMLRVGNLVFGLLLGIAAITTFAWAEGESLRLMMRWCVALAVAVGGLTVVALTLRRVF